MILRCTRKLLTVLGSAVAEPAPDPEDWYANLLWFDGARACCCPTRPLPPGENAGLPHRGQNGWMDLGLRDRVYLVTGGSRGLGFAAAQALAADGARVVLSAPHEATASSAAARLTRNAAAGQPVAWVIADNADPATPGRLIAAARERFGRLDGALISVGGSPPGTVATTPDDAWRSAFESVFLGAVRLARVLAADLGGTDDGAAEAGSAPGRADRSSSCWPPRCACRSRNSPSPTGCSRPGRGGEDARRGARPGRVLHHGRDDPGRRRRHQLDLGSKRISTFPPEHDNGPDRGKQLIRSVIENFNYPGPGVGSTGDGVG